jgi:hypothetical protein
MLSTLYLVSLLRSILRVLVEVCSFSLERHGMLCKEYEPLESNIGQGVPLLSTRWSTWTLVGRGGLIRMLRR